jgi:GDP-L-fucose synthase
MDNNKKVYLAGHNGMVGSAIFRKLKSLGFNNIITKSSNELDLRSQRDVERFFEDEKPEYVFLAAAMVGGIVANNSYKADFIYNNLMIESNIIHNSYKNGVEKLLFLGSSCIYPKFSKQPIKEDYFMDGKLEPTNQPYAIAKIAGIELCDSYRDQYDCNFISLMPTNLYGTNDNYHAENSHVIPGLIRRFVEAKKNNLDEVVIWGSGNPRREFLHVDDLADACIFLFEKYNSKGIVNVGTGIDLTIAKLAELIGELTGYKGKILFDKSKPDGTPRKQLDISKINNLGWTPKIKLEDGLIKTINEFTNINI